MPDHVHNHLLLEWLFFSIFCLCWFILLHCKDTISGVIRCYCVIIMYISMSLYYFLYNISLNPMNSIFFCWFNFEFWVSNLVSYDFILKLYIVHVMIRRGCAKRITQAFCTRLRVCYFVLFMDCCLNYFPNEIFFYFSYTHELRQWACSEIFTTFDAQCSCICAWNNYDVIKLIYSLPAIDDLEDFLFTDASFLDFKKHTYGCKHYFFDVKQAIRYYSVIYFFALSSLFIFIKVERGSGVSFFLYNVFYIILIGYITYWIFYFEA